MKVIKKCKELQPGKYTNDRGYIFYCPTTDAPLDKRIMESGGRVFEYNVQHQQKAINQEGSLDSPRSNGSRGSISKTLTSVQGDQTIITR